MGSATVLTVVTNLWNDESYRWNRYFRYGPAHVNRLHRACARHLPAHEFVCFTDLYNTPIANSFDQAITLLPMWHWGAQYGGCWRRLKMFDPVIEEHLSGEHILALDLDVVITGNMTPIVTDLPDFKAWKNVQQEGGYVCGSMFAWRHGSARDIWDDFDENSLRSFTKQVSPSRHDAWYYHPAARDAGYSIGSEQTWLSYKRAGCPLWTKRDGVLSFKRDLRNACKHIRPLPPNARIVHFHGAVDPSQYEHVDWIRQHWLGEQDETQFQRAA